MATGKSEYVLTDVPDIDATETTSKANGWLVAGIVTFSFGLRGTSIQAAVPFERASTPAEAIRQAQGAVAEVLTLLARTMRSGALVVPAHPSHVACSRVDTKSIAAGSRSSRASSNLPSLLSAAEVQVAYDVPTKIRESRAKQKRKTGKLRS